MRDAEKPIGRIADSGYGLVRAAGSIAWFLHYEGPQSVFVCNQGRVYALPQGTSLVETWLNKRAEWWAGNYALHAHRESAAAAGVRTEIVDDLRDRLRELRAMAA